MNRAVCHHILIERYETAMLSGGHTRTTHDILGFIGPYRLTEVHQVGEGQFGYYALLELYTFGFESPFFAKQRYSSGMFSWPQNQKNSARLHSSKVPSPYVGTILIQKDVTGVSMHGIEPTIYYNSSPTMKPGTPIFSVSYVNFCFDRDLYQMAGEFI